MSTFNNNNNNNIFRKRDYDNAFVMEIKALFDQNKAAKTVGDDDLIVSAFFEDLDHQVEYIDDGGEENDEDDFVCSVAEALADVSSCDDGEYFPYNYLLRIIADSIQTHRNNKHHHRHQ